MLLITTPRPTSFFGVIVTAIVGFQVFLVGGSAEEQVATAMLYVVIGVAVSSLLSTVARTAVHPGSAY